MAYIFNLQTFLDMETAHVATLTLLEYSENGKKRCDASVLLFKISYSPCKCKCHIWHINILSIKYL
jgi:hypothetical protein